MAIYQAPRRRRSVVAGAALAGLIVGAALVTAVHRPRQLDPARAIVALDEDLAGVAGVLEVFVVEYSQSVRSGRIVSATELRGARDALVRARMRFEPLRSAVRALDARAPQVFDRRYAAIEHLTASGAGADEVAAEARALARFLRNLIGG